VAKDKYLRFVRHIMSETFVPIGYEVLLRENKSDNESETFLAAVSATDGRTADSTLNENEGASDWIEVGTKSEPTTADDEYNVTLPRKADSVARAAVDITETDWTSDRRDEEGTSVQPTIALTRYQQRRVRNPDQFEVTRIKRNETRRLNRAKEKKGNEKKGRVRSYIPMNQRPEEEVKKARLESRIRSKRHRDKKNKLNGRTEYGEIQIDNEESHHREHDEETHEEQERGKHMEEEKETHKHREQDEEKHEEQERGKYKENKKEKQKEKEKGKYKEEDGKHIDEEREEGNSSEHDEVMYPADISIIDLVTPTKKKGTSSPVVSGIAPNHKKHFHENENPVVYKINFARDADEEFERCTSACNTLNSEPKLGVVFALDFAMMKQMIESGDETKQWTIQLYHDRGLANPTTKMSDRDLRNVLTPGQFVTDAVVYFYSAQLLNRDLAMIKQKPGRKRCWIYSPHFITRLGREDESVSGYKYTDAINRWGARVPGT
jgi:hypothetical protein